MTLDTWLGLFRANNQGGKHGWIKIRLTGRIVTQREKSCTGSGTIWLQGLGHKLTMLTSESAALTAPPPPLLILQ